MIILTHKSAFRYWRRFTGERHALKRLRQRSVMQQAAHIRQLPMEDLASLGFFPTDDNPLDLLFFSWETRMQSAEVRPHVTSTIWPAGPILQLTPEVGIVSPELCFTLLANEISQPALAWAGMELCGTYAIVGPERKLVERHPLTTAAALQEYVEKRYPRGAGDVHEAAKYVLDGAASPMEAKLALLLTLPTAKGGYGLPAPILNAPIHVGQTARALYPHDCRADLYWPSILLDVEYDGEEAHTGNMHAKDVARSAALKAEGVEVVAISTAQLYDKDAFAQLAKLIGARLGKRVRVRIRDFSERQDALRRELGL